MSHSSIVKESLQQSLYKSNKRFNMYIEHGNLDSKEAAKVQSQVAKLTSSLRRFNN